MSKPSWQQKMKNRIRSLEEKCIRYYEANYRARVAVGSNEMYGGISLLGNEESQIVTDPKRLTEIIMELPV